MKRILLLTHSSANEGGGEEDFFRLVKFLYPHNTLSIGLPKGPREDELMRYADSSIKLSNNIFPFYGFNLKKYLIYIKYGIIDNFRLIKFVKGKKIDVCYINSSVSFILLFAFLFKKVPVVLSIKEIIQPSLIRGLIYKFISLTTYKVIVISKQLEKEYLSRALKKNCELVYPSIEKNLFENVPVNGKNDDTSDFKIVNVGVITKGKGQHVLVEALEKISDVKYDVKFIGKITDQVYYEYLLKLIVNQDHSYDFMGEIKKEDVLVEMSKADIVVVSSLSEGFSFVILQSLLLNLPIISSDVGIAPEVIIDGVNGFLYKSNDFYKLRELLLEYFSNRKILTKLGLTNDFKNKFDLENNLDSIRNLMYSCIKNEDIH